MEHNAFCEAYKDAFLGGDRDIRGCKTRGCLRLRLSLLKDGYILIPPRILKNLMWQMRNMICSNIAGCNHAEI